MTGVIDKVQHHGIEILKRGNLPEEKKYVATCNNCKSVLGFKRRDARYSQDQRDGNILFITCPVCSKTVTTEE